MKTEDIKTWEQLKKDAIEQCAYMDFSDSKFMSEEIDELRAALADRDARIATLEGLKPWFEVTVTSQGHPTVRQLRGTVVPIGTYPLYVSARGTIGPGGLNLYGAAALQQLGA